MSWSDLQDRVRALLRQQQTLAAYRALFGDLGNPSTLTVLGDLARYCHLYRTTALTGANGLDPVAMAYAEGRRDALLYILKQARADMRIYEEAIQRELTNAA